MAKKNKEEKASKRVKRKLWISRKQSDYLFELARKDREQLFEEFDSSFQGLKSYEIEEKLEKYGPNSIASKSKDTWYRHLFNAFASPFSLVLLVIAILNVAIPGSQNWISFGIIMFMVLLSGTLKFIQENKSSNASNKLKEMINTTANVERDDIKKEIPISNIVPGDIVHLAAGDMIPADMRILYAKDLFITQSALNGESEPVEKTAIIQEAKVDSALECNNLVFMGTTVASGTAYGMALQTGKSTFFGKIASLVVKKRPQTSFDKGIKKVSLLLIQVMVVMTLIVFLINGLIAKGGTGMNPWIESLIFSLSIAVGLTPEMLPMIVTLNLSKEAIRFSKNKAIIKNINAIQTFGAMDVLCTDKTGTLTEDRIILQEHLNVDGKEDRKVLLYGFINSYFQTGLKNLIDKAIIDKATEKHLMEEIKNFKKVDEIPFDFTRRRMSLIIRDEKGNTELVTKGASEEVLSICKYYEHNGEIKKMTEDSLTEIKQMISQLNSDGMRVMCVARNHYPIEKGMFTVEDEKDMVLIGYIALLDPPKMSAKAAIHGLIKKGVDIKILTGDNEKVSAYICKQLDLDYTHILLGKDIEIMSEEQLKEKVLHTTIFAKLSPEQKALVVNALKQNKKTVGFMGDGINDAPAMRAADIAISVDTAVDIAKESADVILLAKDLTILEQGVIEGRKTYANIIKYIKITISSNFGNMLSMLIASAWLPFYPLQSLQILLLNIVYDFSQLTMPWDNVDEEFLSRPQNWNAWSIMKFMFTMGPVSTIFDISTFLILFYVFGYNSTDSHDIAMFNAGWFIESALTQSLVLFVLRTGKIPFIQSNAAKPVAFGSLTLLSVCIATPYIPVVNEAIGFNTGNGQYINGYFYLCLIGIIIGYLMLSQIAKVIYKRFDPNWL